MCTCSSSRPSEAGWRCLGGLPLPPQCHHPSHPRGHHHPPRRHHRQDRNHHLCVGDVDMEDRARRRCLWQLHLPPQCHHHPRHHHSPRHHHQPRRHHHHHHAVGNDDQSNHRLHIFIGLQAQPKEANDIVKGQGHIYQIPIWEPKHESC